MIKTCWTGAVAVALLVWLAARCSTPVSNGYPNGSDLGDAAVDASVDQDSEPRECLSSCEGRLCGPDPAGCAESCGQCRAGFTCSQSGECECQGGIACGDSCCGKGEVCDQSACCTPSCEGRECGFDACGGSCGECPAGSECLEGGLCSAVKCAGISCAEFPELGWTVSCNQFDHCQYARTDGLAEDVEIYVPAGSFPMGTTDDSECTQFGSWECPEEHPQHTVTFSKGYFIDKFEVSNRQYAKCVEAGVCEAPTVCSWGYPAWPDEQGPEPEKAKWPAFCVSRGMALAYCQWTEKGLPTEAQWERAAKGTSHRTFPWGDLGPTCDLALTEACGQVNPDDVDSHLSGASPVGAVNLAGNVAEWVEDCYHPGYEGAPTAGTAWMEQCVAGAVIRGGHYQAPDRAARTSARTDWDCPECSGAFWSGIRCVRATGDSR